MVSDAAANDFFKITLSSVKLLHDVFKNHATVYGNLSEMIAVLEVRIESVVFNFPICYLSIYVEVLDLPYGSYATTKGDSSYRFWKFYAVKMDGTIHQGDIDFGHIHWWRG